MMTTRTTTRQVTYPNPGAISQALLALCGGLALFVILILTALMGYSLLHAGQVYPGVSVAGVDLSGLSPDQAATLLSQRLSYPQTGKIVFKGAQSWTAKPAELGLYLDPKINAWAAYNLGRQGSLLTRPFVQLKAWYLGVNLPPILVYDQRLSQHYLENIAAQVDTPVVEASLAINGTDVVVTPGRVGRSIDIRASLQLLDTRLRSMSDGLIPLVIKEQAPAILDASAQAEIARKVLSAPLVLQLPNAQKGDPGPWTFDQPTLAKMLTIERVDTGQGAQYQVALADKDLRSYLEDLAPKLEVVPANARFTFNDDTRQLELIQSAVIGRSLNLEASLQEIQQKLANGEHTISLVFNYTNPQVGNDATAAQLGITEQVSVQSSYFYGSSAPRIHNIEVAAARFHGVLVAPGATFSMADVMGDVSLDTGYAEALIIYGNRTIQGVGGGVCQVSTTLFRTVFFGGYPIVERHPHAYRVSYYEYTASGNVNPDLAGLDATVFVPVVDFRFTNDTSSWLLMETYVNEKARKLTWKFYSTSDGRKVDWTTTGLQNVVDPPAPLYQENPDLNKGEIHQVDWEAAGADVTVSRTVYRNDQVYIQDDYSTHYLPWRAVFEYGPGTKIPKD